MVRKIYEYIKENGPVSCNQIGSALNIDGKICLSNIEVLRKECFIKQCPAVALSIDNNCSCFYTATNKSHTENHGGEI